MRIRVFPCHSRHIGLAFIQQYLFYETRRSGRDIKPDEVRGLLSDSSTVLDDPQPDPDAGIMFTLLSSRRLLISAISLLIAVMIYRLLSSESSSTSRVLLARKILAQIPSGALIENEDISKSILPTRPPSEAHIGLPRHFYHDHNFASLAPPDLAHLSSLLTCNASPNPHTNHIRLPNLIFNVSSTPPDGESDGTQKFNPTIIALPHWSPNHYLLVSRVVTEGLHQESLLCEANICHLPNSSTTSLDSTPCTTSDTSVLGFAGGLRCVTKPETINIPPTPAERCTGAWSAFPDIPGFHDPRILWSGKGEPLIVVNSASRYGCVGLWIVDLRTLHKPLQQMLEARGGKGKGKEPLMSYPHLTELMRLERSEVEKNWMLFFPGREEAFVHYDMVSQSQNRRDRGSGRSFAKLIGNGYTTPDLADPSEASCFDDRIDGNGQEGHWHQGGNALKLILCTGAEAKRGDCHEDQEGRSVHFAVMHRKFSNDWDLPLRYERWFALWEGKAPFRLLARSRFPLLFANETAGGWTGEENWEDGGETMDQTARQPNSRPGRREGANLSELLQDVAQVRQASHNPHPPVLTTLVRGDVTTWLNVSSDSFPAQQIATSHNTTQSSGQDYAGARKNWAYFTYTPSIAWSWRPTSAEIRREDRHGEAEDGAYLHSLNVGYLDDEVIVGIGLEDTAQAFAKVKARTLLQCLELCPGAKARAEEEGEGTTAE